LLSKLIWRLPQTLVLKPDTRVYLRDMHDQHLFWNIFSGEEYLPFVPHLARLMDRRLDLIDCGAANGLFTLWIWHLAKIGVFPWSLGAITLVEPSAYQTKALRRNIAANLEPSSFVIREGLAGRREGHSYIHEGRRGVARLGSSYLAKGSAPGARKIFIDLDKSLRAPALLKLDIEGGEFDFIEAYGDRLGEVRAIIVEWHLEYGELDRALRQLARAGFTSAHRTLDKAQRKVDLLVRTGAGGMSS
jgi:FkbM family methyltransferase